MMNLILQMMNHVCLLLLTHRLELFLLVLNELMTVAGVDLVDVVVILIRVSLALLALMLSSPMRLQMISAFKRVFMTAVFT